MIINFGLPFVYALLENKEEASYKKVFDVTLQLACEYYINTTLPDTVMSDFELAIINAARTVFGIQKLRCCLFRLGQSIYRHVQREGLQRQYCCREDPSIGNATHSLIILAFAPPEDIEKHFQELPNVIPENFLSIYNYFEST